MAALQPVVPNLIVNELLTKQNYEEWKIRVETYLRAKGLWSVVDEPTGPPIKGKEKRDARERTNSEALHVIHICCGSDAFKIIKEEQSAHEAWIALALEYEYADDSDDEATKQPEEMEHADAEIGNEAIEGDPQSDEVQPKEEGADEPEEQEAAESVEDDQGEGDGDESSSDEDEEIDYKDFLLAAKHKDWNFVLTFLKDHPEAIIEPATLDDGKTVLHYAVEAVRVDIVKKLLTFVTDIYDLEVTDDEWCSALDYCFVLPDKDGLAAVDIAKCFLEKEEELHAGDATDAEPSNSQQDQKNVEDDPSPVQKNVHPSLLVRAYTHARPKMTAYLYKITPLTSEDPHAAQLISLSFSTKRYDIACKLIQKYPKLAIVKDLSDNSPLNELASTPSSFLSGSKLKFWEKWIYHVISITPTPGMSEDGPTLTTMDNKGDVRTQEGGKVKPTPTAHAVSIEVLTYEDGKDKQSGLIRSVTALFRGPTVENICKLFGISHIYEMKLDHVRSREILHVMCKELRTEKKEKWSTEQRGFIEAAIFQAAQRGLVEFLTAIFKVHPNLAKIRNEKDKNIFQVAVECRQAKVVNLIHGFNKDTKNAIMSMKDDDVNNMLHMMGLFSPFAQTNNIRGAALQMQKELQWFKELASMASPEDHEVENDTFDMKPREFFSKNHEEMVKEGEKSMKETATSCTVVGALIVTMMFAAAFTLPGGNDDNGDPVLRHKKAFRVFIIADAISLFTSTTSVMLFLGILTSRYAEEDFLKTLPRKMILGLLTLFLSVAAMMIAFGSSLFLILREDSWIAGPTTLLTGIPIASFMWMQFPFLLEIFISTYVVKIFDKNVNAYVKLNLGKVRIDANGV